MEIIKTETRQTISISGDDLKGFIDIVNGHIDECTITIFTKDEGDITANLTESQVRQLAKEFKDVVSHLDNLKGPQNDYIDHVCDDSYKEEPMPWEE